MRVFRFGASSPKNTGGARLPSEKSLANLRPPWKKGESGNPKGRPKGSKNSFESIVRRKLDEPVPGKDDGTTKLDVLAEIFVSQLLNKKNREAFAHYIEREWPKVSKHEVAADVELSGEMEIAAAELARFLGELE